MTSWTARIDALLPTHRAMTFANRETFNEPDAVALIDRLALAAERLKEPHAGSCTIGCWDKGLDDRTMACTCGKDSDMARILEGR